MIKIEKMQINTTFTGDCGATKCVLLAKSIAVPSTKSTAETKKPSGKPQGKFSRDL